MRASAKMPAAREVRSECEREAQRREARARAMIADDAVTPLLLLMMPIHADA